MSGTRSTGRHTYFPSAALHTPVTPARFKAFGRAVGEAHCIRSFDHADLVHVPTVGDIAIGHNLEGDLDSLAGIGAQIHDRARPYAAAGGVVARREVGPGVGAVFDLHNTIAVTAESMTV